LFAGFWLVLAVPFAVGWALLAAGGVDQAEARRAQAAVLASVASIAVTASPPAAAPALLTTWISVAMYAQVQYVSAHAKRAVFLSRFLSPRVSELIASRGFADTMRSHSDEITVVCADLRGFTAYSEAVPARTVVDLLAEYYDACGEVVAKHGGTITNYAGDGVLILVGAPVRIATHAATGIQLAHDLRIAVEPVLDRARARGHALGLGIGVASGTVMVGAIAARTRMEYTAIGMPVNLAARLCARAAPGEILIARESVSHAQTVNIESRGHCEIKGFSEQQEVFALLDR
jgi:class 3 adenylate cyclase